MLATIVLALAQNAPLQEAKPAKPDSAAILDQLIERSRELKAFSATYRVTFSDKDDTATLRLDYRAPDALRMDFETAEFRASNWSIGDVLDVREMRDGKTDGWHLDASSIQGEVRPIEDALARAFPPVSSPTGARGGVIQMTWSFNVQTNKNDWHVSIGTFNHADTPLGWLKTLKTKSPEITESGEHVHCSTDNGRFELEFAKNSGVMERLLSRKLDTGATSTIELVSFAHDDRDLEKRFEVPAMTSEIQRDPKEQVQLITRDQRIGVRNNIWFAVTNACKGPDVDSDLRAKFEALEKPLHELMCHSRFDEWLDSLRDNAQKVAEYLREQGDAGKSAEEVERMRADSRSKLVELLDKSEASTATALDIPESTANAACAPKLLDIERELARSVFRDLVRDPLLDEFDRVAKTD